MSSRVTRSAARRSAGSADQPSPNPPAAPAPPSRPPPPASTRKRKTAPPDSSPAQTPDSQEAPTTRSARAKRTKIEDPAARNKRAKGKAAMSSADQPSDPLDEKTSQSSRRKSNRKNGDSSRRQPKSSANENAPDSPSTSRRSSRKNPKAGEDTNMEDAPAQDEEEHSSEDENGEDQAARYDEEEDDDDEDDDPFTAGFLGRHPAGLSALRQLTGLMSGMTKRLRDILENLKSPDMSMQLMALQELSEVLLISTEDNLAGHFSPDAYVKELVKLMQPNEFTGEENPEIMLLACRCLANLMEALPAATANVVYGGAVPVLCQKLLEINFIDLAEQCLSTLEKVSIEYPSSIVRDGGLTACLTYLDFFATSTQRTAVTTAANCCRNIPEDSFPTVRDVMPVLENILNNNSDQKVVEQGCICVSRIVQSFRHQEAKLEELVSTGLLKAILRLLLPGTTNLIGPNIHTMFLQVLAYTAKASPRLSAELLKMNVVDTLYQILTGVSPPSSTDGAAVKIESVVIMQALIHRPKDQVYETLNVICELLPDVSKEGLLYLDDLHDAGYPGNEIQPLSSDDNTTANAKRVELLQECKAEVKRFTVILLPTLTDAYSSTVNLGVREKVLTAHLKMLSNLDVNILEEALRAVPYASFLAAILSQQDHTNLVTYALQAAELLLKRLESIYRYQFYREGVMSEIVHLADRPCKTAEEPSKEIATTADAVVSGSATGSDSTVDRAADVDRSIDAEVEMDLEGEDAGDDEEHDENSDNDDDDDDDSASSSSSDQPPPPSVSNAQDLITLRAKKFIEVHEKETDKITRDKASRVLEDLKTLANEIRQSASGTSAANSMQLFTRLAAYFEGDALDSITSYELKTSRIVDVLLDLFSGSEAAGGQDLRSQFLEAFMSGHSQSKVKSPNSSSPATAFSALISKLQDLLSRSEHFEVFTVHQHAHDTRGSATSMLAKQLRLKLMADDDSGIPKSYRNIMVSIHAIATFKALDDYLRPRISAAERPRGSRTRDHFAAYAQAIAEGRAPPPPETPSESTARNAKKSSKSNPSSGNNNQAGPSAGGREKTRRSSRRQQAQPPPPPPAPTLPELSNDDPVECADEDRLSDEESIDETSALNAIVDDLEDELDDDVVDPSAVSVEVAATGKATAHKEDGTRIATPVQGTPLAKPPSETRTPASRLSALLQNSAMRKSLEETASALSYAAALQSTPQDWHIEFSVNDQPISNETTIYRAVHFGQASPPEIAHRTVWNNVHTIKFKKVQGPPPAESKSLTSTPESASETSGMPASLNQHPVTSGILRLLSLLHSMNSHLDDILFDSKQTIKQNAEPLSQFVNTKLTAKLNRQLEEPLIVASNCLPTWSEDLARLYPFLFPFETRHLFLQSTSFGYSRSMTRWQNSQTTSDSRRDRHRDERPFLGRLQRQKVRISRSRILESAMKVMQLYGHSASVLEVEYFEEVGTGLGPTLEFYSTVSREFSRKALKLWRENDSTDDAEYAFGKRGLFPAPMSAADAASENGEKRLELFKVLGKFVARSMMDSRIIDVSFNPTFFRVGDASTPVAPSLGAVKSVDQDLAKSLGLLKQFADAKQQVDDNDGLTPSQKTAAIKNIMIHESHVEDLALDFTLPGFPSIELQEKGADIAVTIENVGMYIEKVMDFTLGTGVHRQVDAFRAGFSEVFPYSALKAFTPDELVMLFGRTEEDWTLETLMDSMKADHGYNLDSKSVRNLLQTMSEFTPEQRREFLQFITGSPKLPIGGFKNLTPMFTVVCKPSEPPYTSDDYLPSVMTCVNYLKMPDYSTINVLREKLTVAMEEGQGAFHLS